MTSLVCDAQTIELDFTERCNDHADHDNANVAESSERWLRETEHPGCEQNSNRGCSLEHLDKADIEVEICNVAADQRKRE